MAKKRVTRKELLKEPDEFMTFTGKLIQFVRTYQQYILYGTGALILTVLVVSGLRYYRGWQEGKAYASLEKAISAYTATGAEGKNLPDAKQNFQAVIDEYAGYNGGKIARVMYANICYELGDFDSAIEAYQKALEDYAGQPSLKTFIQSSIGYSYQGKQNFQAAADQFEAMVSDPVVYMKDEALYNLGILYAKLGKMDKSREAFQKILSDYADSSYIEMVKEQLAG
jgi:tetratricopeptide (TPR) repeat protein